MPLHLVKLAVGIDDIEHLRRVRAARTAERGGSWVFTINRPRRATELLDGGSIYWVIRGQIRARQRLTGFRSGHDADGRRHCLIEIDAALVPTLARTCRPFQGWRYLSPNAAPADRFAADPSPLPDAMLAELRELGLIGPTGRAARRQRIMPAEAYVEACRHVGKVVISRWNSAFASGGAKQREERRWRGRKCGGPAGPFRSGRSCYWRSQRAFMSPCC